MIILFYDGWFQDMCKGADRDPPDVPSCLVNPRRDGDPRGC